MRTIRFKIEVGPEDLASICTSTDLDSCVCKGGAICCPFEHDGICDCWDVTPEMWAELLEEEDGEED